MPYAHQGEVKYAYRDHDTDLLVLIPPVQAQWYTLFDAEDVRCLYCKIYQENGEGNPKNIKVKWTIDGTVYYVVAAIVSVTDGWIFRNEEESGGGTGGLEVSATRVMAGYTTDKRGQNFKVEVCMSSAPGSFQQMRCWAVRETLEQT